MIDQRLQAHLEAIAQDERQYRLWRGLAWCWTAAGSLGLIGLLLHWSLDWSMQWGLPVLAIVAFVSAGIVVYRWLRTPSNYRLLAQRIEQANPNLQALLLTAVEQQPEAATGEFNYLQRRVIDEALAHRRQVDWGEPVEERLKAARRTHWVALAGLVLILAALRPYAPLPGRVSWAAHSNGIAVTPGDTSLERGSGLVVLARFSGKLPAEATLIYKPVNEAEIRIPLTKNLDDPVFGSAIAEVNRDLTYHIDSTVGKTREFKVTVFDYPRLERADAKLTYPSYTGLAEKTIRDTRRVSAVVGAKLDYDFYINKAVTGAKLVAKDKTIVPLERDANNATVYHSRFTFDYHRRYELVLVDEAGRTNKVPPEFVFEALTNRPPELKLVLPRGDQRVSPLEEVTLQGEVSDDFGVRAYGLAYTLAGQETKIVELGKEAAAREKRPVNYLLPMEALAAQPDQLLSYYLWADAFGPDGQIHRTAGDMFFAEVRPFDEIFREGQSAAGNENSNNNGAGQEGNQSAKLAELQKQIISATWNLQRRETGAQPSAQYKKDVQVIHESQEDALKQVRERKENLENSPLLSAVVLAEKEMAKAAGHLSNAVSTTALRPLTPALASEQAAYQALLRLQAREFQVARGRNQRGGSSSAQRSQRQVDQLDLQQTENRYEAQRQASPSQNPQQREQLQVLNRLKELAQRQQDLNQRIKELQSSLQSATSEAERQEIRRRLKRLREEEQQMLADVDELRQRMDRPENQSQTADARQQLDDTRTQVERAAEALEKESASQALTSGTRAQRELQQLQDEFRKNSSSQFAEDMRRMRQDARDMAQKEEGIAQKLKDLADSKQRTLSDSEERRELTQKMAQQKGSLTNLFTEMRQVSEQAEAAEPLLSRQLYDLLRQSGQDEVNKAIDTSSELVRRGFVPQAGPFEQKARQNIDQLKQGVERAAESVLGDEAEALRLAKRELEEASQQLDRELAQAEATNASKTNAVGRAPNATATEASERQLASARRGGTNANERIDVASAQPPRNGQRPSDQASAGQAEDQANSGTTGQAQESAQSPGGQNRSAQPQASANSPSQNGGNPSPSDAQANRSNQGGAQRNNARTAIGRDFFDQYGSNTGGGGDPGPLTGNDFVGWSDRLRDVEEMLDVPELRTQVARVRDRARVLRQEYKKLGKKPDWAVVRTQISAPLAEVRARVTEELDRLASKEALVPIDRDPVPAKFSELVRRYYEKLGKSE